MKVLKIVFMLFIVMTAQLTQAQNHSEEWTADGFNIGVKLGALLHINNKFGGGPAFGFGTDIIRKDWVYTIDYSLTEEYPFFRGVRGRQHNFNLLFGRSVGKKWWRFHAQAGVGLMGGYEFIYLIKITEHEGIIERGETDYFFNLAFPAKMEFKFIPWKHMAIGVEYNLNVNTKQSFHGPMLTLEFGILRRKKEQ